MNPVWNPFTDRETKGMITGDLRNKTCVDSGGWPLLAIARSKLIHGSWFCTQARYVCVRRAYILQKAGTAYSNTSMVFGSRDHSNAPWYFEYCGLSMMYQGKGFFYSFWVVFPGERCQGKTFRSCKHPSGSFQGVFLYTYYSLYWRSIV